MKPWEEIDITRLGFGTYWDELPLWSAPFARLLLEVVPLRNGISILEIGPGTGFLSLELAERCGVESRVTAVDPWAAGLERFRDKLAHLGLTNVEPVEGDAADLDLEADGFDLIVSSLGVNNFAEPERVLENCFRMARPGAALVLTSNVAGHMSELYAELRATLAEMALTASQDLLRVHEAKRGSLDSISELVTDRGFEVTRTETDSFRMRFADGTAMLDHHLIRLGFLGDWRSLVPETSIEAVFDRLEERLNALARRRGELALTVPMVCVVATKPGATS